MMPRLASILAEGLSRVFDRVLRTNLYVYQSNLEHPAEHQVAESLHWGLRSADTAGLAAIAEAMVMSVFLVRDIVSGQEWS